MKPLFSTMHGQRHALSEGSIPELVDSLVWGLTYSDLKSGWRAAHRSLTMLALTVFSALLAASLGQCFVRDLND